MRSAETLDTTDTTGEEEINIKEWQSNRMQSISFCSIRYCPMAEIHGDGSEVSAKNMKLGHIEILQ